MTGSGKGCRVRCGTLSEALSYPGLSCLAQVPGVYCIFVYGRRRNRFSAAEKTSAAEQVEEEVEQAHTDAPALLIGHGRLIGGLPCLIPAAAGLQPAEQVPVGVIIRFHLAGCLLLGVHIPAQTDVGQCHIIIPQGVMLLDIVKDIQSLIIVAVIDIIGSGLHAHRPFIIGAAGIAGAVLAVTGVIESAAEGLVEELGKIIVSISAVLAAISAAVTGIAAAAAIAAGGGIGVLPFVDDLLVSGLHLFEHFLRLLFIGVVNIGG